jgi:hypothetical protein
MIDFNLVIFVILLIANIMLCIVKIPMFGFTFAFMTLALTGLVFMNYSVINVYFSYLLIFVSFASLIINGLDFRRKK